MILSWKLFLKGGSSLNWAFFFSVEEKAILNKGELLGVNVWDAWNSHLMVLNFFNVHTIFPKQNKLGRAYLSLVRMGRREDSGK